MRHLAFGFDLALDDDQPPQPGDVIVSTQAVYRVMGIRAVESKVWANRFRVEADRIGDAHDGAPTKFQPAGPSGHLFGMRRYKPGERPGDLHWGDGDASPA